MYWQLMRLRLHRHDHLQPDGPASYSFLQCPTASYSFLQLLPPCSHPHATVPKQPPPTVISSAISILARSRRAERLLSDTALHVRG